MRVTADGAGVMSHAGVGLLREVAGPSGLTEQVSTVVVDTRRGQAAGRAELNASVRSRWTPIPRSPTCNACPASARSPSWSSKPGDRRHEGDSFGGV